MSITPRNIVFVHPDLGIGGAERLVIDAAVGLQSLGHKVTILTSHRDTNHCFEEARDGTLDVRVRGNYLFPSALGNRLSILFAILRQMALIVSTSLLSSELRQIDPDVFFVDQLSAGIPLFRLLFPKAKVLFYGHYPDQLLVTEEHVWWRKYRKALYRIPFDAIESWSTLCADSIAVNSKFTRSIFRKTFPEMRSRDLKVVYPCVDTSENKPVNSTPLFPDKKLFLSINRFENKKNLDLAIHAFSRLSPAERAQSRLVLAGGFDPRNTENAICYEQLRNLSDTLQLPHTTFRNNDTLTADLSAATAANNGSLLFLLSIPTELKQRLLHSAALLLYTPRDEHFGIVPLEAMLAGVPVLATNTGGPLETVYDGRTGWLRSPDSVDAWTDVLRKPLIPSSADNLRAMGQRGRERVLREFSQTQMTDVLNAEIQRLVADVSSPRPVIMSGYLAVLIGVTLFAMIAGLLGLRVLVGARVGGLGQKNKA